MINPLKKYPFSWIFFFAILVFAGCTKPSVSLAALSAPVRVVQPGSAGLDATVSPTIKALPATSTPYPIRMPLITLAATPLATQIPKLTDTTLPAPTSTYTTEQLSSPILLNPKIDNTLTRLSQQKQFSGSVLVARGSNILIRQGYGYADRAQALPNTSLTRFRIGSLTKSFTAAAVLALQAQGKLTTQDLICVYLSPCPSAWQAITIHELLTHTSGIADYANSDAFGQIQDHRSTPAQIMALFKDLPLQFAPGSGWRYSNSGYVLLGMIIEKVSGERYEEYVEEHLLRPLGLKNTGMDHSSSHLAIGYDDSETESIPMDMSSLYSAGGFYSTVEDLFRWSQALMNGSVLPKQLSDLMITPFAATQDGSGRSYGYGWFLGGNPLHPWAGHAGRVAGYSADVSVYLDDELIVVTLSNQTNVDAESISSEFGKMLLGN
jgi:CubicO group peptidase (beta-lactamase class C family)